MLLLAYQKGAPVRRTWTWKAFKCCEGVLQAIVMGSRAHCTSQVQAAGTHVQSWLTSEALPYSLAVLKSLSGTSPRGLPPHVLKQFMVGRDKTHAVGWLRCLQCEFQERVAKEAGQGALMMNACLPYSVQMMGPAEAPAGHPAPVHTAREPTKTKMRNGDHPSANAPVGVVV